MRVDYCPFCGSNDPVYRELSGYPYLYCIGCAVGFQVTGIDGGDSFATRMQLHQIAINAGSSLLEVDFPVSDKEVTP